MSTSEYQKTILPDGLTIVTEKMPAVRSVTVGMWIKSGARDEPEKLTGVAHYLEHMLFKGTETRSALDIARSLESVGGYLNAYTSKEHTCFFAEILADQLPLAVDVLSDMLCNSLIDAEEFEKEREIVLDEIDSVEDTPDDLVQEIFMEKLYPDNPLGAPILGNKKSVRAITREDLAAFHTGHYTAGNIVVAAAGNLEHNQLVELCWKHLSLPAVKPKSGSSALREIGRGEFQFPRPLNQAHLCIGTSALSYADNRKYDLLLLNTLLGVGMGSRLFQNIREKHGLAYSIYSFLDFFKDNGLLAIYMGTEKKKIRRALDLLRAELGELKSGHISDEELLRIKSQVKGNLLLGLESTARRMSRLAKMEIYLNDFYKIDQIISEVDKVSREGLIELGSRLFSEERILNVMFIPS